MIWNQGIMSLKGGIDMNIIQYFDDRVLSMLFTSTLVGVAIIFLLTYSVYKKPYLNQITYGLVIVAIGMVFITLRDHIPSFMSIIMGNALSIGGIFCVYDGMVCMIGRKTHLRALAFATLIFTFIHLYFTYLTPSLVARIINFSFFESVGLIYLCFHYLLQMRKAFNYIMLTVFITHLGYIGIEFLRILNTVQNEGNTALFSGTSMLKYLFLYSTFLAIVRAVCVMLYNTKDLV